jgi:hypothetical protein
VVTVRWLCSVAALAGVAAPVAAQEGGRPLLTIALNRGQGTAELRVGSGDGDLAARYHSAGYAKPIFWPVNAPGGVPLTRAWPMDKAATGGSTDHVHQKSAWFCHGDVIPEGVELKQKIKGVDGVDFWSEAPGHGKIVCTDVAGAQPTAAGMALKTHNEWRTADGTKVLDEDRVIAFSDLGKARLIVLRIDLHASVCPVTFGDTKEGSFGVRINDAIRAGKFGPGKIENAHGKVGEKDCWGHTSDWCDYSGPIDGKTVGLAILADPKNAQPTFWHVRDYGLMAANPFGRKKAGFHDGAAEKALVRLAKGEHLQLRYGLLLHEGDATAGQVAEHFQQFVKLREKE